MLVALGVGGGIAAYKAAEIVRGLDRGGAEVQVIMTRGAAEFITPLTLQTLSRRRVLRDQFDLDTGATVRHVELTRDLAVLAVAPATANLLAKFAHGVADDFLSTFYTAATAPVVIAPAMNTRMWLHAETQANVHALERAGVDLVAPESGWLAEQEDGVGRLADPDRIVARILDAGRRSTELQGRRIVVSAGPTREPIDPVRYLSNRSSGKMGYALATAARRRGAEVVLISGPVALAPPFGVKVVRVQTAAEMRRAVLDAREGADAVIMAAAVADHAPQPSTHKIKKSGDGVTLELHPVPDILSELGATRRNEILVGFAAETENLRDNALEKLRRKKVDFIVANDVSGTAVGIDADDNAVTILDRDGGALDVPRDSKLNVARAILDRVFAASRT